MSKFFTEIFGKRDSNVQYTRLRQFIDLVSGNKSAENTQKVSFAFLLCNDTK